RSAWVKLL
ncbi:hypothetical protein D049_1980B, partial [Vibrio parahaemolyticus VPTS-2010]